MSPAPTVLHDVEGRTGSSAWWCAARTGGRRGDERARPARAAPVLPQERVTLAKRRGPRASSRRGSSTSCSSSKRGAARAVHPAAPGVARTRFDLALLFPNAFAPAPRPRRARVRSASATRHDGRAALLTNALAVQTGAAQRHEVFYYLNLVSELGRVLTGERCWMEARSWPQSEASRASIYTSHAAGRRGRRTSPRPRRDVHDDPLVALCPGRRTSRAKRWTVERYAALANCSSRGGRRGSCSSARRRVGRGLREVVALMRHAPLVLDWRDETSSSSAAVSATSIWLVTTTPAPRTSPPRSAGPSSSSSARRTR